MKIAEEILLLVEASQLSLFDEPEKEIKPKKKKKSRPKPADQLSMFDLPKAEQPKKHKKVNLYEPEKEGKKRKKEIADLRDKVQKGLEQNAKAKKMRGLLTTAKKLAGKATKEQPAPAWVKKVLDRPEKHFIGANGNELVAYEWIWTGGIKDDPIEGNIDIRVSDWDNAYKCSSDGCTRKIVHVYWVHNPKTNETLPYGKNHLHQALGFEQEYSDYQINKMKDKIWQKQDIDRRMSQEAEGVKEYLKRTMDKFYRYPVTIPEATEAYNAFFGAKLEDIKLMKVPDHDQFLRIPGTGELYSVYKRVLMNQGWYEITTEEARKISSKQVEPDQIKRKMKIEFHNDDRTILHDPKKQGFKGAFFLTVSPTPGIGGMVDKFLSGYERTKVSKMIYSQEKPIQKEYLAFELKSVKPNVWKVKVFTRMDKVDLVTVYYDYQNNKLVKESLNEIQVSEKQLKELARELIDFKNRKYGDLTGKSTKALEAPIADPDLKLFMDSMGKSYMIDKYATYEKKKIRERDFDKIKQHDTVFLMFGKKPTEKTYARTYSIGVQTAKALGFRGNDYSNYVKWKAKSISKIVLAIGRKNVKDPEFYVLKVPYPRDLYDLGNGVW
jgi:hypothetical protein